MSEPIHILGAGPAGLAAGYYLKQHSIPFTIYEAGGQVGGNCRTIEHNGFRFDTGAHRFHDRNAEVTEDVKSLLGDKLKEIEVPSQIYFNGKLFDFPLSPMNLFKNLGAKGTYKAMIDYLGRPATGSSFESKVRSQYGNLVAESFLLNYSEKLWGIPGNELAPAVAGKRLNGLNLRTFLLEAFKGSKSKTRHLDGKFYYPDLGFGMITDSLAAECGRDIIRTTSRITSVKHNNEHISGMEINNKEVVETGRIISTLPVNSFVEMMDPVAPVNVLEAVRCLKFRHVILIALFIDKPSINNAATTYFPGQHLPFTRIYEPRNRSVSMSPHGKTSLVAEIPCFETDAIWKEKDEEQISLLQNSLINLGWVKNREIIDGKVIRIKNAYPVLDMRSAENLKIAMNYLQRFKNLSFAGRSGLFAYTHLHDQMINGKQLAQSLTCIEN